MATKTKMTKKKVGILGGTFNPPHLGHLIMASQAMEQLNLDEVYFMPDYLPPHVDPKTTIDAKTRLAMLELALADNPQFQIEPLEVEREGVSYSIDTMRALTKLHPENDYYFIIGGDMVDYLSTWKEIDELVKLVTFVGIYRPGFSKETPYPVVWVESPAIDLSSSLIRQYVNQGWPIKYLVPAKVADYIAQKRLYQNGN